MIGSLSTFHSHPHPYHPTKGGRDSECICQRPTDLCVQLFWYEGIMIREFQKRGVERAEKLGFMQGPWTEQVP